MKYILRGLFITGIVVAISIFISIKKQHSKSEVLSAKVIGYNNFIDKSIISPLGSDDSLAWEINFSYPIYEITLTNNNKITITSEYSHFIEYEKNTNVFVLYNALNPQATVVNDFYSKYGNPIAILVIFILLLYLTI